MLVSGSSNNTIKLWNTSTNQEITTLKGHTNQVEIVCFNNDNTKLFSGNDDGTIKVWNLTNNNYNEIKTIQTSHTEVYSMAYSPLGNVFVSGGLDD